MKMCKTSRLAHLLQSYQTSCSVLCSRLRDVQPPHIRHAPTMPRFLQPPIPRIKIKKPQTKDHGAPTRTAPPSSHLTRFNVSFPSRISLYRPASFHRNALSSRTSVFPTLMGICLISACSGRMRMSERRRGMGGVRGIF
jgi:hypothetical protein